MPLAHASLDTLPPEIIENILITAVGSGDISSIASIAASCKYLFKIVYRAIDRHLWRSLFRTTFDDPTSLRCHRVANFDWRRTFEERHWTRRYIASLIQPLIFSDEGIASREDGIYAVRYLQTGDDISHTRALRTLLSIVHTSVPATSHPTHARIASVQTDQRGAPRLVPLVQLHRQTGTWPPEAAPVPYSENVRWLQDALARGLPSTLTAKLVLRWIDKVAQQQWFGSQLALDLCAVTALLGLLPIPETAEGPQPLANPASASPLSPQIKSYRRGSVDMSEAAQRARAHLVARELVFDMGYLKPYRNWGPYLSVPYRRPEPEGDHDDDDGGDESDDDFVMNPSPLLPPAHKLLPDWSWLAAARIVAESVLRTHRPIEDIQRLVDWNNLREGAWLLPDSEAAESTATASGTDVKVQQVFERDWAGVEGVWRRLVCWLDYESLLDLNVLIEPGASEVTDDEDLEFEEAWIIVPLSLRITGYSACPIPEYADRPTIHVEGEMGGAEWLEEGADAGLEDQDVRRVHGTVSMLADGNVRWCITSMDEDNTEDQWASEAIQLGGLGSAMGSLGMWTGVNHEEDDPVGVIWQWRVGERVPAHAPA